MMLQNLTQMQKMAGLIVLVVIVLGIFFLQQGHMDARKNQPMPTPVAAGSGNIVVNSPVHEASVPTDFLVQGKARVFEGVVYVRVSSRLLGKVYYEGTTMAQAPDMGQFGPYTATVHLNGGTTLQPNDRLLLEVFQRSARDGTEIDKVTINLYFSPQLP